MIRPTLASVPEPATRQAHNGVRHRHLEDRDVYELPAGAEGIPAKLEVIPRPWWRGGTKVEARDDGGKLMDCSAWKSELIVIDARSGLTTTLHRDSLDLDVKMRHETRTSTLPGGAELEITTPMEEHLAADGSVIVRTEHETRAIHAFPQGPTPGMVVQIPQYERFVETRIPAIGATVTVEIVREETNPPKEKATLTSWVDQSGVLTIIAEDGTEQRHALPIPLHALEGMTTCESEQQGS